MAAFVFVTVLFWPVDRRSRIDGHRSRVRRFGDDHGVLVDAARGRISRLRQHASHAYGSSFRLGRGKRTEPPAPDPVLPRVPRDESRRSDRRLQPRAPSRLRALGCVHVPARPILGCLKLVAAWTGLVYIAFPWHLARTPHGSLVHLEFLPLLILASIAAARRPSWSRFALVAHRDVRVLAHVRVLRSHGSRNRDGIRSSPLPSRFHGGAGRLSSPALPARPSARALSSGSSRSSRASARGAGLNRVAGDLRTFGVRPLELILPSPGNLVLGSWPEKILGGSPTRIEPDRDSKLPWRRHDRPGSSLARRRLETPPVSLAAASHRHRRTDRRRRRGASARAPSPISVLGREIWMPSRLLWEIVPAVRVPSRWTALVMTALIPLAALGLQSVWTKLRSSAGGRVAYAVVLAIMAVSVLELTIHPTRPRFETTPLHASTRRSTGAAGHRRGIPTRHDERPHHLANAISPRTPEQRGVRKHARRGATSGVEPSRSGHG